MRYTARKIYVWHIRMVLAYTSGCCVAIATKQPDVPAYTKCDVQLIKLLLMMD